MKTALITGKGKYLAAIARALHADGYSLTLCFPESRVEAHLLAQELHCQALEVPAPRELVVGLNTSAELHGKNIVRVSSAGKSAIQVVHEIFCHV